MSKEFFSIEEFKNRWAKVRSSMKSSNIELLMVISPTNINNLIGTPAKGYQEFETKARQEIMAKLGLSIKRSTYNADSSLGDVDWKKNIDGSDSTLTMKTKPANTEG